MTIARRDWVLLAVLGAGLALRLWFVLTTHGTNDAAFMTIWAQLAERYGIPGAYAQHPLLNHPPLSLWILRALARTGDVAYRLRLLQIAADAGSFACLLRLGKDRWPAFVFFLSPVAILISGFHCNTDSTMVCLILVAVVFAQRWPAAGGVALALATGIKIVPLLLLPLFLIAARRRWWQSLLGFGASFAALFLPVIGNPPAMTNIFGYAGHAWWWGFPALAARLETALPLAGQLGLLQLRYGRVLVALAVLGVAALFLRRKEPLPAAIGLLFAAVLFVSTGFGVQYLLWPLPFLPFLCKRWETLTLHAAASVFLAAMYTSWSRGWPWTYADSLRLPWPMFEELVRVGFVVWVALGWAAAAGAVRMARGALPSS